MHDAFSAFMCISVHLKQYYSQILYANNDLHQALQPNTMVYTSNLLSHPTRRTVLKRKKSQRNQQIFQVAHVHQLPDCLITLPIWFPHLPRPALLTRGLPLHQPTCNRTLSTLKKHQHHQPILQEAVVHLLINRPTLLARLPHRPR